MRLAQVLSLAVLAALVLAGCARPGSVRDAAPAPAAGPAPIAPVAASPQDAGAIVLRGPEGTQWVKPGVSEARYRGDVDSCVSYATARVAHDERIENDSAAAFDAFPSGLGTTELRSGMNRFERQNRRGSLFNDCMIAKGYTTP